MSRETVRIESRQPDVPVMIGKVVKPHGIHGEIKIHPFSGQPENFIRYKRVSLQRPGGGKPQTYEVVKCREQGRLVIARLQSVDAREAAEALVGSSIWLNPADLPELGTDEYYWHQLEGLQVETERGRRLGRVVRLFNTSAHDIMVVAGTGQEFMIPVKGEIIRSIDRQAGKIVISPPPGLLELNR